MGWRQRCAKAIFEKKKKSLLTVGADHQAGVSARRVESDGRRLVREAKQICWGPSQWDHLSLLTSHRPLGFSSL